MDRFTEAATVPFRSLHMGRLHTREESLAVNRLQTFLQDLQSSSALLPTRLLARRTPFSPPTFFGPFNFGNESVQGGNPQFGRQTDLAVRRFQEQVGTLDVDGKAGMQTLHELLIRIAAIRQAQKGFDDAFRSILDAAKRASQSKSVGKIAAGAIGGALGGIRGR
jgi:hypothetical protein